jgi:hypothetical protein
MFRSNKRPMNPFFGARQSYIGGKMVVLPDMPRFPAAQSCNALRRSWENCGSSVLSLISSIGGPAGVWKRWPEEEMETLEILYSSIYFVCQMRHNEHSRPVVSGLLITPCECKHPKGFRKKD